jgi:hypothetical protein
MCRLSGIGALIFNFFGEGDGSDFFSTGSDDVHVILGVEDPKKFEGFRPEDSAASTGRLENPTPQRVM